MNASVQPVTVANNEEELHDLAKHKEVGKSLFVWSTARASSSITAYTVTAHWPAWAWRYAMCDRKQPGR